MSGLVPYYERDGITIYHGDCRDVLPTLVFDVVVTDPPYGTGGWRRPTAGRGDDPTAGLIVEAWDDGAIDWLALVAPRPVCTFWPPARTYPLLHAALSDGLAKHRCLYYQKPDPKPQVSGRVRWSMEPIWVLSPEGFVLHGGDDVWRASAPRVNRDAEAVGHPYQKPLSLMYWLVAKTAGVICDPFTGSGTTLVAAQALGRRAIGIEIEERYCQIAAKRLQQMPLPLESA